MDMEFRFVDEMAAASTALNAVERGREPVVPGICQASEASVAGPFHRSKIVYNNIDHGGSCSNIALRKMGSRGDSWG